MLKELTFYDMGVLKREWKMLRIRWRSKETPPPRLDAGKTSLTCKGLTVEEDDDDQITGEREREK